MDRDSQGVSTEGVNISQQLASSCASAAQLDYSPEGLRHSTEPSSSPVHPESRPQQFWIGGAIESPIHPNNRQVISRSVRATVDDETRNAAVTKPQVIGAVAVVAIEVIAIVTCLEEE